MEKTEVTRCIPANGNGQEGVPITDEEIAAMIDAAKTCQEFVYRKTQADWERHIQEMEETFPRPDYDWL